MEQPIKKNDVLEVTIADLTYEGMGVAKIDHFPIFIENALPEEVVAIKVVKVLKKFAFGIVTEFIKKSPYRVEADKKMLQTGIAPLQHLAYDQQLLFKKEQVKNVLSKIAKMPEVPVEDTLGMTQPFGYRNKVSIPIRQIEGQLTPGFFRKNSHNFIPMTDVFIQDPAINEALEKIVAILNQFGVKGYNEEKHHGFMRHIIIRRGHYTKQMMIVFVTNKAKFFQGEEIAKKVAEALPEVVSIMQNINTEVTNVILGNETKKLYGQDYYEDQLLGKTYRISAPSFFQVNTLQTEKLYETAINFAGFKKSDVVIDAYCGIGTIGLSFAEKVEHVFGVEVVKEAVADARINAVINGIENTTYKTGSAEHVMEKWQEQGIKPSVIVVDPPRKGLAESFIKESIAMSPEKIVYISCNPATLARDLVLFNDGGYNIKKVQPVDLFPQTTHVETVVLMSRVDK